MLVGHVAVGLAVRRAAPSATPGMPVLAAVLPDLLWCLFLLIGIEQVELRPGRGAVNYLAASNIAWSHSLLMTAVWGVLLAAGYLVGRRHRRTGWILMAAVLSHWLLDFIAHAPDMPLAPGLAGRYGLGMWHSLPATVIVEGGMWLAAVVIYARQTRPSGRAGTIVFWTGVVILTLAWQANLTGPPPSSARAMALSSLVFFSGTVTWAYWIDRLRRPCYNSV